MKKLSFATALALVLAAGPGSAFTASNGLKVTDQGGGTFLVAYGGKSGPRAFWCAAGDYAQRVLRLGVTDNLWRMSEPPRGAGQGVIFSVSPQGAATDTGIARFGPPSGRFSVGRAQNYCNDPAEMVRED
ncbi:MAG: hypothetical protein U5N10_07845 [Gemmobacter sp.]|nr:hypothetical protein [Gemmobacter sp.]